MIFDKLLPSKEMDFTILFHDQAMKPRTFHRRKKFIPFCHKLHYVFDELYLHWIKTLVKLLASNFFGDGRTCNLFALFILLTSTTSKLNFFLRVPKLLDRLKHEFQMKIAKEQGVGARSLARNILGVEGCVGAPKRD
jgi:hypothetical protein